MPKRTLKIVIVFAFLFLLLSSCAPRAAHYDILSGELAVIFMDTGQSDCALIISEGSVMLVDTATSDKYGTVKGYLDAFGVRYIDVLVLTHPHADHIGGAAQLLTDYAVGSVMMPDALATTTVFENTLDAILDLGLNAKAPEPGDKYTLGGAEITFISPPAGGDYRDLNDSSITFVLKFGDVRMIFTGDMGTAMENIILKNGYDIDCDLIKVSHHGSRTASGENFIAAVSPDFAVFTTAAHSPDGLPDEDVILRFEKAGAMSFFTHRDGAIIAHAANGLLTVAPLDEFYDY